MKALLPIIAGGGLLAYFALRQGKRTAENVTIQPLSGSFTGITIKEVTGNIIFRVINPEPLALPIKTIFANLIIANKQIGTVANFETINIPGRSTRELKVSFALPVLQVGSSILSIIQDAKDGTIAVGITGYIDTAYGRAPLDNELSFKIPFV